MRFNFAPQISIGANPIKEIEFDLSSRHELTYILRAIQHLYIYHKDVVDYILNAIKHDIDKTNDIVMGRKGLNYWEIFVMSTLRLGCDYNYAELADQASYHWMIRQILGLSGLDNKRYPRSTVHDNLNGLSPETLDEINQVIISVGHELVSDPLRRVRGDSFVLKKNIHYPTDANMLHDAIRKTIEISAGLAEKFRMSSWRQHAYHKRQAKKELRQIQRINKSRKSNKDDELKSAYENFIGRGQFIASKAEHTIRSVWRQESELFSREFEQIRELNYYIAGIRKIADLAWRRVILGESIPHDEKIFSLFEPDTEMIHRGKTPNPFELGHRVLIIEDGAGFILRANVLDNGFTDEKVIVDLMRALQDRYEGRIRAASFDKGFWTPFNLRELSEIISLVVLPKKGKRSQADQKREGSKEFGEMRKWHSGVESRIHSLMAGNGMGVCRDKGVEGYERYVGLAVLGRNLHTMGKILIDKERERNKKREFIH